MLTLVIGGARSGKSRFAQTLAARSARVVYLATARAEDAEMEGRIARHRGNRPAHWHTVEEPLAIGEAVERHAAADGLILLDCLTLWLSNFCWEHRAKDEDCVQQMALQELGRVTDVGRRADLVLVTNELGNGMVPETHLGRFFRDLQGWVNQDAAQAADWVYHMVAGIAVPIKRPEAGR